MFLIALKNHEKKVYKKMVSMYTPAPPPLPISVSFSPSQLYCLIFLGKIFSFYFSRATRVDVVVDVCEEKNPE